jgi:hypothetical protein
MLFLKRVWGWIRRYWKWVLFPIGILGAIGAFVLGRVSGPRPDPNLAPLPDGNDVLDRVKEAEKARDEALEALKEKNKARLQELTEDQREELRGLDKKPIEEVTAWFDALR